MKQGDLIITQEEWNARIPDIVRDMTAYVEPYCTAIPEHTGEAPAAWGSGSYIALGGRVFILTNEHIARDGKRIPRLLHQLKDREEIYNVRGDRPALGWPVDIALLPIDPEIWTSQAHGSKAITPDMMAFAHAPVEHELLFFTGFSGERSRLVFDNLFSRSTSSQAREVPLPTDEPEVVAGVHLAVDYRPDLAITVVGTSGLPKPKGFSGSALWNTRFVECLKTATPWSPDMARVTGLIWGAPSGCIVATRIEYVRSFLLGALDRLVSLPDAKTNP